MAYLKEQREPYLNMLEGYERLASIYRHKPSQLSRFGRLKRTWRTSGLPGILILFERKLTGKRDHPMAVTPEGDLSLGEESPHSRGDLYFSDQKIAVYSALFDAYDEIPEPLFMPDNISYFIITDQEVRPDSRWTPIPPESVLPEEVRGDAVLSNRWCKMHPDLLFPEFNYSIYLDANILPVSDLTPLVAGLERFPVAMFRHKTRNCVYEEVRACILQRKDKKSSLLAHQERLRKEGIPEHWGLLEAPVIARKHHDPRCLSIMNAWWENFRTGSRRDQISLIETLYAMDLRPEVIGTLGRDVTRCGLFVQMSHNELRKK